MESLSISPPAISDDTTASKAVGGNMSNGSASTGGLVEKERIYMSLLERRIAELEALLSKSDENTFPPDESIASPTVEKRIDVPNGEKESGADKSSANGIGVERVRYMTSRWDDKAEKRIIKEQSEIDETPTSKGAETEAKKSLRAFTFTKVLDDDKKYSHSTIEIEDPNLKNFLQDTIKHYPGITLDGDVVLFISPYVPLVHNWTKLEAACKPLEDDSTSISRNKEDLTLLLNCVRGTQELESYFKIRDTHLKAFVTSFEHQWSLFCPGNLVYATPFMSEPQVFKIQSIGGVPVAKDTEEWTVTCLSWDWNGTQLEQKSYQFKIERYENTRAIDSLICYPIEFYGLSGDKNIEVHQPSTSNIKSTPNNGLPVESPKFSALRPDLVKRGREFIKYSLYPPGKASLFEHRGPVIMQAKNMSVSAIPKSSDRSSTFSRSDSLRRSDSSEPLNTTKTVNVEQNVIVDFESYLLHCDSSAPMGGMYQYQELLGCHCAICRGSLNDDASTFYTRNKIINGQLEDEHYLLCPPRVLGYVPHLKQWAQFKVGNLHKLTPTGKKEFADTLELDEDKKEAIWALVDSHENARREGSSSQTPKKEKKQKRLRDFTDGKGNGLVLLFHGPPGVGKTLTAELVAKASGKPLFSISVAEIGLKADTVEMNLERHFALAARWEAVLLIDEADVFLESRESGSNSERNSLVSVMLRILEYYDGILILTTNRVPALDIAVLSRIHLAVKYKDLETEQSLSIWNKLLGKIEHENSHDFDSKITTLVKKDVKKMTRLNGRQIRNIITSAQAWAQQKGRTYISFEDIDVMYELVIEFQETLGQHVRKVRGGRELGEQ